MTLNREPLSTLSQCSPKLMTVDVYSSWTPQKNTPSKHHLPQQSLSQGCGYELPVPEKIRCPISHFSSHIALLGPRIIYKIIKPHQPLNQIILVQDPRLTADCWLQQYEHINSNINVNQHCLPYIPAVLSNLWEFPHLSSLLGLPSVLRNRQDSGG